MKHQCFVEQVMDWERTVQLDNEMYTSLSPGKHTGDANATARRELHRLQLQATELGCHRDRLLQELELAVSKRDTIAIKVSLLSRLHARSHHRKTCFGVFGNPSMSYADKLLTKLSAC